MGYFSNGTEGAMYEAHWCDKCISWVLDPDTGTEGCPVMDAHLLWNSDEHDKPDSVLHRMIPIDRVTSHNGRCFAFRPAAAKENADKAEADLADAKRILWATLNLRWVTQASAPGTEAFRIIFFFADEQAGGEDDLEIDALFGDDGIPVMTDKLRKAIDEAQEEAHA